MTRWVVFSITLLFAAPSAAEKLRVLALPSEPFFYEEDGQPMGIEYEILELFAKSRGVRLDITFVDSFPELLERIANGDGDIASGTITITEARDERMDFSAPYFPVQVVLVERAGEASESLGDLAGKSVAAFEKTTAEEALRAVDGVDVVRREGVPGMLEAVRDEEIHGAAGDSSAIMPVIDDYPELTISLAFGERQHFGFALPEGSELKKPLSRHIAKMKEAGIFFRLVTKHMGPQASSVVRAARDE